ncbi:class I SAM-dependent methyltransferase [Polynucleobacter sp. 15G-AUS-farblos]|uniref:class I SAM-dependent methyltransferase n=1 Tax=Polynucleobacter sp. 15G-AUS-farblos TaxID=2689094 RepID=UPI001C0D905F|nr:class I SAM-dependent methyltransferase [Polynucleobacter sp. 15G-AUS-farblos]MBU3584105.1 class I SAM-dependent methyltransferase [Polynucleobacter sp. 15G-AUS-farblos]
MNKSLISNILAKFPKIRPALPKEIELIHNAHYHKNREGETPITSISQKMESWLHKKVADDVCNHQSPSSPEISTLEIGAGSLNQLPYEPEVGPYDIIEPFTNLYKDKSNLSRIRNKFLDINEINLLPQYDRVTSIAALEHITNLPEVVAKSGLLLKENGRFRAAIPNEGTFLWTLGWKLTTGIEFKLKYGLDYSKLMAHEHVNTSCEIIEIANYFFKKVRIKSFGLNRAIAFYVFLDCQEPRLDRCDSYLQSIR